MIPPSDEQELAEYMKQVHDEWQLVKHMHEQENNMKMTSEQFIDKNLLSEFTDYDK